MTKLQLWTIQWWIIQSVLVWKANGIELLGESIVQVDEFSQGKICSKVRQLGSLTLKKVELNFKRSPGNKRSGPEP